MSWSDTVFFLGMFSFFGFLVFLVYKANK